LGSSDAWHETKIDLWKPKVSIFGSDDYVTE
jgi:hypothetical protein